MQKKLETYDFSKFKDLKKNLIDNVDRMLSEDISKLMSMIPGVSVGKLLCFNQSLISQVKLQTTND